MSVDIIPDFVGYQIDWLKSHNDLEFEPVIEDAIVQMLKDTEKSFIDEQAVETSQPDHNADIGKKVEQTGETAQNVQNEDLISRKWLMECIEEGWVKFDTAKDCNRMMHLVRDIAPSVQPERKKPVFKTGESVYHVSYADGTGGFEKNKWADWTCPDCGWFVGEQYIPRRHNQQKCNYCAKCGCAIDWSDADMRGEQDGRDD